MSISRRTFLGNACSSAALATFGGCRGFLPIATSLPRVGQGCSYWCTWGVQNAMQRPKGVKPDDPSFAGHRGAFGARNTMSEKLLFGSGGWAKTFFPDSRSDLYLVLDDGWDVPFNIGPGKNLKKFASLLPNAERFPSLGATGPERLKNLNARIKAEGWKGTGLWVACQSCGEDRKNLFDEKRTREAWIRRLEWSRDAGIMYWKVDWGVHAGEWQYRQMISDLRKSIHPELIVEHMPLPGVGCFNGLKFPKEGGCKGSGRIFNGEDLSKRDWSNHRTGHVCGFADVVRIYDMLQPVDLATTFERIAYFGSIIDAIGSKTLLNVEGSVTVGAVLGNAFGVMRAPGIDGGLYGPAPDISHLCERFAEVDRAVVWQRMAPAFGGDQSAKLRFSKETLTDVWKFQKGEGWKKMAWGRDVYQTAPAVLSRGCELPKVKALEADKPFVAATLHPNGTLAVGAFPRVTGGRWWTPKAEISVSAAPIAGMPIAVFGETAAVRIKGNLKANGRRIIARDLIGKEEHDITSAVAVAGGETVLPGEILAKIGREGAPQDIYSAPGTIISAS